METATARRPSGPVLSISHFRSASPTRVKLPSAAGARSPATSVSVSSSPGAAGGRSRRSCMCSPTNHPGSFRCSLHKERNKAPGGHGHGHGHSKPASPPSPGGHGPSKLGTKQRMGSAMARLVSVEGGGGQWARRAIAPSSAAVQQSQHRRRVGGLRPRPSRLSAVSMAGDRASDNSHQGN